MRRPACASAQSDLRLCYSHYGKYHMLTCYRWNFNFLASLCSWGDWFETRFVRNPEDRFSRDEAQLMQHTCIWSHSSGKDQMLSRTQTAFSLQSQTWWRSIIYLAGLSRQDKSEPKRKMETHAQGSSQGSLDTTATWECWESKCPS